MRRLSPVNIGTMGLTILFICLCGGAFLARNTGGPWRVLTTRNEAVPLESASEEDMRLVSLLPGERINLNTASARDLTRLPEIGEKRAADIVAFREKYGPFRRPEDLMKVSGISRGTFEQLREHIEVSDME